MTPKKKPPASRPARDTESVPAAVFKAKSLELVNRVSEREVEYVITRHGRPMARLVPAQEEPASAVGFLGGSLLASGDIVSPDPDAWEPADAKRRRGR